VFDVEQKARSIVDEVAWQGIGVSSWIDKTKSAWKALFGIDRHWQKFGKDLLIEYNKKEGYCYDYKDGTFLSSLASLKVISRYSSKWWWNVLIQVYARYVDFWEYSRRGELQYLKGVS
jgi:hypothetical protein